MTQSEGKIVQNGTSLNNIVNKIEHLLKAPKVAKNELLARLTTICHLWQIFVAETIFGPNYLMISNRFSSTNYLCKRACNFFKSPRLWNDSTFSQPLSITIWADFENQIWHRTCSSLDSSKPPERQLV